MFTASYARISTVAVKRQDEVVQHLSQQMIAKTHTKKKQETEVTSQQRAQSQAILMLKAPMWAGSMSFCLSWTFMTLR